MKIFTLLSSVGYLSIIYGVIMLVWNAIEHFVNKVPMDKSPSWYILCGIILIIITFIFDILELKHNHKHFKI
jgi:hypothetical protein